MNTPYHYAVAYAEQLKKDDEMKQEPKPDVVKYLLKDSVMGDWSEYNCIPKGARFDICIKLTFDGETGKLKSAEVLK